MASTHEQHYLEHRGAMMSAAYRILGTRTEAEDAVQEVWLRWVDVDLDEVRTPQAYLVTMATRDALNRARSGQRRREQYVGPWLPEPWAMREVDGAPARPPDPHDVVEQAESVSMAMLVVLASLTPIERAVFVLREVFDLPYADIAAAVDRTPSTVRQIAHRARGHVHARRPQTSVDTDEHAAATTRFVAAVQGGSIDALLSTLAPNVVLTSDGGGQVSAALRPIHGRTRVAAFLLGIAGSASGEVTTHRMDVNGQDAIAIHIDHSFAALLVLAVEQGVVAEVFILRNPDKLDRL
ncbi:MAG: RNA polymerase sigma factor SigJ [Ornithinimicrobium sp.]